MKILLINIFKDAIISEVALTSAYAGAKMAEDFERVATANKDNKLLTRFWMEVCGRVADKLKSLINGHKLSETSLQLQLSLSGNYDESLNESVESDLFSAIAMGVTAGWFRYSLPEKAAEWKTESERLLTSAFSKLCYRRKPQRP